jgi:hypothetical protein
VLSAIAVILRSLSQPVTRFLSKHGIFDDENCQERRGCSNIRSTCKSATMSLTLYRAIGLLGAAIFVVAYLANQARWLKSEDWRFPAANLAGALLILISLFGEWNLPSVVIEAFWAAISVYGLCNRA